jgi:hypothetical protein
MQAIFEPNGPIPEFGWKYRLFLNRMALSLNLVEETDDFLTKWLYP